MGLSLGSFYLVARLIFFSILLEFLLCPQGTDSLHFLFLFSFLHLAQHSSFCFVKETAFIFIDCFFMFFVSILLL